MMAQLIDRKHLKQEMKELLRSAQVSPRGMTCLYLALVLVLNLADSFMGLMNPGLLGTFISILTGLMSMVLASGFVMYCMAIRRGERAEYLTLFDGFSFVGKVILLNIVIYLFTFFWSLLFVIPGIIAAYRYRFALYNLYENPGIGVMEALNMSKQQTLGYKEGAAVHAGSELYRLAPPGVPHLRRADGLYLRLHFSGPRLLFGEPHPGLCHHPAHARRIAGGAGLCLAAAGGAVLPTGLPVHGAWLF